MTMNSCTICGRDVAADESGGNALICGKCAKSNQRVNPNPGVDSAPTAISYASATRKRSELRSTLILSVSIFVFSGVWFLPTVLPRLFPRARITDLKQICASNLRGIGQAMYIYAMDEPDEKFPDDIAKVVLANNVLPKQCSCPATLKPGMSYYYVPGHSTKSAPNSVLMYEGPQNHKVPGANVLFADGHVEFVSSKRLQELINEISATQSAIAVPDMSILEDATIGESRPVEKQ